MGLKIIIYLFPSTQDSQSDSVKKTTPLETLLGIETMRQTNRITTVHTTILCRQQQYVYHGQISLSRETAYLEGK